MKRLLYPICALLLAIHGGLVPAARADEGMFLYDIPPVKQVKETYGFDLKPEFLQHLQLSTVRFGRSGTGSFVSPNGLVATNHHVGSTCLFQLSTPENNLLEKGFYAPTAGDELKCAGLELLAPVLAEDVTDAVNADVKADTPADKAQELRNAATAKIEKEYSDKTKLRCTVTKLYQGGKFYLYGYKIYNDIRLVWAPEAGIASFGGDPDNYEYPRYCIDCTLFRAYEDGKPAKIEHFFRWSKTPVAENDLIFVSGFPGSTQRSYTREHLEYQRDVFFPWRLQKLFRREVIYSAFANRNVENARRIEDDLDAIRNYRKRAIGQLQGLQTPSLWGEEKAIAEGSPEDKIRHACLIAADNSPANGELYITYDLLEAGEAFNSKTFQIARTLVRLAYESEKPNSERLKEYQDSNLESLKQTLFANTPIYEDVEIIKLTDSLTMFFGTSAFADVLSDEFPEKKLSPKEWTSELIPGSKVRDVAERKRLAEGGVKAIEASKDPMIQFVLKIEQYAREIRKRYEENVEAPMTAAYAELAKQRFEKSGTNIYPDATFTLRLSYGAVKGYKEDDGTPVASVTTIAGMFDRAEKQKFKEPFDPPQSWKEAKSKLNLNTPFNFVTTNDIVGGNSGSPMVNTKGEIVGLAFDGNIYSLPNNFVHTEEQGRCVGVCTDVILEALQKVYNAQRIISELQDE